MKCNNEDAILATIQERLESALYYDTSNRPLIKKIGIHRLNVVQARANIEAATRLEAETVIYANSARIEATSSCPRIEQGLGT